MGDVGRSIGEVFAFIAEGVAEAAIISSRDLILGATREVKTKVGRDVRLISRSWREGYLDQNRLQALHQRVGLSAQRAMVSSYNERKGPSRAHRFPPSEFAGGKLGAALASPNFFIATPRGVEFGVTEYLDRVAKQWYRMNFGVGPESKGTPRAGSYTVQIFSQGGDQLSLSQFTASPKATDLPRGFFVSSRAGRFLNHSKSRVGQDAFVPAGRAKSIQDIVPSLSSGHITRSVPSRGHAGIMYMDAGMRELTRSFGLEWTDYSLRLFNEAARKNSGAIAQFLTQEESREANIAIRRAIGNAQGSLGKVNAALAELRRSQRPF